MKTHLKRAMEDIVKIFQEEGEDCSITIQANGLTGWEYDEYTNQFRVEYGDEDDYCDCCGRGTKNIDTMSIDEMINNCTLARVYPSDFEKVPELNWITKNKNLSRLYRAAEITDLEMHVELGGHFSCIIKFGESIQEKITEFFMQEDHTLWRYRFHDWCKERNIINATKEHKQKFLRNQLN